MVTIRDNVKQKKHKKTFFFAAIGDAQKHIFF